MPPHAHTWQVMVYQLDAEGPADDDEGEDSTPSYREWVLPAAEFHGSWEALVSGGRALPGACSACKLTGTSRVCARPGKS